MNVLWAVSTDFMSMERRLQRGDDKPSLEVLRVVQQTHTEMLSKLTDTTNTNATTVAVIASTVKTIAETQREHGMTLVEHDKAIQQSEIRQAESRGFGRAVIFAVPLIISVVVAVIAGTAYILERIPLHGTLP